MGLRINRVSGLKGRVKVPPDKSISHRSLMIGALAEGKVEVENFLQAADTLRTKECVKALGIQIEQSNGVLTISGKGLYGLKEPDGFLDVGNSGTTLRVLPAVLAAQDFFSVLTGDDSIRKRPMDRVIIPLSKMGAEIWAREKNKFAPLAILGRPLEGISYTTPVPSAQVKSALILAGILASGTTEIREKFKSRDHTERMLKFLGAEIKVEETMYRVEGKKSFGGGKINVPSDFSSAAYFIAAASVAPASEIVMKNIGVNPTRVGFLEVLESMGASFEKLNLTSLNDEPRADIRVISSHLKATTVEGELIPRVIDEIPLIAVLATQAEGETTVKGAAELRVKETDRITAICKELTKMGANIEEFEDGFSVEGPTKLKGVEVESYGDHRMAMALAVAGLIAGGKTAIKGAECIEVSFPAFEETLKLVSK